MTPTKRCALYYPQTEPPDGPWLRQSLLYWDEVGSIVSPNQDTWVDAIEWPIPQSEHTQQMIAWTRERIKMPDHIRYLEECGQYRRFPPMSRERDPEAYQELTTELLEIVDSSEFQDYMRANGGPRLNGINVSDAVYADPVFQGLETRGLALEPQTDDQEIYGRYKCDSTVPKLHAALDVKYLAALDDQLTVPSTDEEEYYRLCYRKAPHPNATPCIVTVLHDLLPVPRPDTKLAEIVKFKERRRDSLLGFRAEMDNFESEVAASEDHAELQSKLTSQREKIEKGIADLEAALSDARIATALGTLEALIKPTSPAFWATFLVAADQASKMTDLTPFQASIGIATASLVVVSKYLRDRQNERNAQLRNSPFAYLHYAKREAR